MSLDDMTRLGPVTADDLPLGLQGLDEQPDQMGLGLSSDPNTQALQEGQVPGWVTALKGISGAIEAFGAGVQGRTPLFMQQQEQDIRRQHAKSQADLQRQQVAQQLLAQQETKRQNQWEDVFKVLGNDKLSPPQSMTMLKEMGKTNRFAATAAQQVNEKMLGEFHTLKDALPRKPEEYAQGLQDGTMTWHDVSADLDVAREDKKQLAKDNAQQRKIQGLVEKFQANPDSMTDTELDLLDTFKKGSEERALKIEGLKQGLQKGRQELTRGTAPIVSPGMPTMEGTTKHIVTDATTGAHTTTEGVSTSRVQTEEVPKVNIVDAAKVSGLNLGVKDVRALRDTIVQPDGTVNRHTLFTGKVFGGLPFTQGKDIDRWILDMVAQKVRLETGATMRPDEKTDMMRRFAPKVTDPDSTIVSKMNDLEQWHLDAINIFDPTGAIRGRMGPSSAVGAPPQSKAEIRDKIQKTHPKWTKEQIMEEMYQRGVR